MYSELTTKWLTDWSLGQVLIAACSTRIVRSMSKVLWGNMLSNSHKSHYPEVTSKGNLSSSGSKRSEKVYSCGVSVHAGYSLLHEVRVLTFSIHQGRQLLF